MSEALNHRPRGRCFVERGNMPLRLRLESATQNGVVFPTFQQPFGVIGLEQSSDRTISR